MPNIQSILVTGAGGQLGKSIKLLKENYSEYNFIFVDQEQLDLSNNQKITEFFQNNTFDFIINCAAYTAVDEAETQPEIANLVNHLAVKKLAEVANNQHVKLIHISTDYVFNGQHFRPYIETDRVDPQGVYGRTKLKGEQSLLEVMPNNAIILRTSWLYSEFGHNFVKTMLKLGQQRDELNVIFDQVGTPTYAYDLAQTIMKIVSSNSFNQTKFPTEIYHYSNEGVCSWYDFANTIFELNDIECAISPIETSDYPTPAARPHYSVLNKTKIKQAFDCTIPHWKKSLKRCLAILQEKK